jgi:hypothetical protein
MSPEQHPEPTRGLRAVMLHAPLRLFGGRAEKRPGAVPGAVDLDVPGGDMSVFGAVRNIRIDRRTPSA